MTEKVVKLSKSEKRNLKRAAEEAERRDEIEGQGFVVFDEDAHPHLFLQRE